MKKMPLCLLSFSLLVCWFLFTSHGLAGSNLRLTALPATGVAATEGAPLRATTIVISNQGTIPMTVEMVFSAKDTPNNPKALAGIFRPVRLEALKP